MIDYSAFCAELDNGHRIIAYTKRSDNDLTQKLYNMGDRVSVEMTPYDMSKGCIVLQATSIKHESQSFC